MEKPDRDTLGIIINFDGIRNFRDLGGLPSLNGKSTKKGILFRSGKWANASEEDLSRLTKLGIRTVIDLRPIEGQKNQPDRFPLDSLLRPISLPLMNDDIKMFLEQSRLVRNGHRHDLDGRRLFQKCYRSFPTDFSAQIRVILNTLASPENLPTVFHCSAGKDRAGFLAGVLLDLLGVSRSEIMQDYLLSNWCRRELINQAVSEHPYPDIVRSFLETRPEYLEEVFREIEREYGSLAKYLAEAVSVTPESVDMVKRHLLD